jgi:glycosyltransferase involved in cell wall biosynthesis
MNGPAARPIDGRALPRHDLLVDLTTIHAERGRHAHGTTRVERGLVAALSEIAPPSVGFCRYDRLLGRFVAVDRRQAQAIATAASFAEARREVPVPTRRHPLRAIRRRAEVWLRSTAQRRLRTLRAGIDRLRLRPRDEPNGATILIPGELQRHDFARIAELRRMGTRVVFLFYDLLRVLPADDPRLRDPVAIDLPGSDFMVREAALILAISRFSAEALGARLKALGIAGPPVEVIRLAGALTPEHGRMAAVPELAPGGFVASVGDVVERKNHAMLVSIWRQLVAAGAPGLSPLAVVGRIGADQAPLVQAVRRDPVLRRYVRFLPNLDDGALAWVYTHCRFTVFPSHREGFGLPVAESLAFGKVCVASAAEAIPEASQGLAIHLDPAAEAAWLATITRLLSSPEELARREGEIRARYRRWTWQDSARDVLRAIDTLSADRSNG